MWGLAIAYNLVRLHMQHVAQRAGVAPCRISFRHTLLLLRGFWLTAWLGGITLGLLLLLLPLGRSS